MLPHAVPLDAYRSTAGPAGCASLTAQGSLPRQKVQLRRRFSTPPAVGYAVCNDLRCEHMPHRSMRARYMREPSSHGLQATGRLRVSNYTRHATTPRATVLAPSGTGSALEGHSSGTAHVLYRTSCPLRVPRRCWPRRLRPKASKRRAAARKYAAPTPSSQDCLPSALELCSRQRKAAALYVCATLPHQPRTLRFYHGTRHATAPRCAAPATSSCSLCAAPHPLVRPLATGRSLDARGDDHRRLRCR